MITVLVIGVALLSQNRGQNQNQQTQQPTSQPVQEEKVREASFVVNLFPQNNSGESGIATLTPLENGKTKIVLNLVGAPRNIVQPAHIHTGSCANLGDVLYGLTFPVNGQSETELNISINEGIFSRLPLAINVHKSADEANIYYACGDITSTTPVPTISSQITPSVTGEDRQGGGGTFQTPDDRRRGAGKPED